MRVISLITGRIVEVISILESSDGSPIEYSVLLENGFHGRWDANDCEEVQEEVLLGTYSE